MSGQCLGGASLVPIPTSTSESLIPWASIVVPSLGASPQGLQALPLNLEIEMTRYLASWEILVEAETPVEAAEKAREMQHTLPRACFTISDLDEMQDFTVEVGAGERAIVEER